MFEQIKTQEQTKQAELKAKEAEFNAQAAQAAIVSTAACSCVQEPGCLRCLTLAAGSSCSQ